MSYTNGQSHPTESLTKLAHSSPGRPAIQADNRTLDLERLVAFADQLIAAENDPSAPKPVDADAAQMEQLLRLGSTAMGGARPKATVEWRRSVARQVPSARRHLEQPACRARDADTCQGMRTVLCRNRVVTVGSKDVLMVKRFDRHPAEGGVVRSRLVSALTLLGADDTRDRSGWSYLLLADELRRHTGRDADLAELYRRVCFNALISNTDDHPRNHALIARLRSRPP